MLSAQLVQSCIRSVPATGYFSRADCGGNRTARLLQVRAVIEAAFSYVRSKVDKIMLKLLLGDDIHHLDLKGGKARRVGNKGVISDIIKLYMAGSMAAAPELLAHLTGLYPQFGDDGIEYAGLSDTGVACKRAYHTAKHLFQLVYSLSCQGARADNGEAGLCKYAVQLVSRVDVALIYADHKAAARLGGNNGNAVNKKRVGYWICVRGNKNKCVNIGDRWADKPVPSFKYAVYHALPGGGNTAIYSVPDERRRAVHAKPSARLALEHALCSADVVKPAQSLDDNS